MLRILRNFKIQIPKLISQTYEKALGTKNFFRNLKLAQTIRDMHVNKFPEELNKKIIHWGIAPVSLMADDFATALTVLPAEQHQIVSCVASYRKHAMEFAERHGVQNIYNSFNELAACPYVDCVYISPLNPLHWDLCHLMLNHDKHVLCEKPLCMTEHQVLDLMEKAKQKRLFLMEGMWPRCVPAYHYLRRQIARDAYGEIFSMYCTLGLPIQKNKLALYGGVTSDLGVYGIQLALWIFQEVPERIKACGSLNEDNVDVNAKIELMFSRGRCAHIVVSAEKVLSNEAIIRGTKRVIRMTNYWCPKVLLDSNNSMQFPLPYVKPSTNSNNRVGMCYEAGEVRKCLLNSQTESDLFNHRESLLLANIIDTVHNMLGVVNDITDHDRKILLQQKCSYSLPPPVPERTKMLKVASQNECKDFML